MGLIKGPLSARPKEAPAGTIYWANDTDTFYEYDDATWSVFPAKRADYVTKAEYEALKKRVDDLEGAITLTVTFNTDGGSTAPATQTIAYNAVATKPTDPTKDGFTFLGWFLPEATTAFNFNTKLKKSVALTAHWEAAE